MRVPFKSLLIILVALSSSGPSLAQDKNSEFCSSQTTEAYHSPRCDWWVVHDPRRIEHINIPHRPRYHTYSRWLLGDRTYIFAYRDVDQQPEDMVADIYLAGDSGYNRFGYVHITGAVTDVSTANLTGGAGPDVVFRFDGGQLQYIDVLRFSGGLAREVFSYGASTIDVISQPKPLIVAKSRIANLVQEFEWDSQSGKFKTIHQRALRKDR
jgi:hypothetical protein